LPFARFASASPRADIPVGLELYSVRDRLKDDPQATVRAVAQMGYAGVEFYAPYWDWNEQQTKDMRKLLDQLGIRCFSTHNDEKFLAAENLDRTRDMNLILGSKYVVQAYADPKSLDGWKRVADQLNAAAARLEPAGLHVGYHNHEAEWKPVDGQRPLEVIARNTKKSIALQLDVGTCLEAGADPVAWIREHPGRIKSMHCKDWSRDPAKGYAVEFGEGIAPWKEIFAAAEGVGGIQYYLIEQEAGTIPELDRVRAGLKAFRAIHGGLAGAKAASR
jgi:sugar phosphate isomerase/epimerase